MQWSAELRQKIDGLTRIQQRAIERIVLAEAEGVPLSRLLRTAYSCRWCGQAVGRWSDSAGERAEILQRHERECTGGDGLEWQFVANASTFYGKWRESDFPAILAQARAEFGAEVLREAAALLQLGASLAVQQLMRIIEDGEDDTNRRLAAVAVLDRASALTARKGTLEIERGGGGANDKLTQLLDDLRSAG